jgi:hypothetical protein
MPRKKLIRHFEPRYGVSREMVDVEATYVAREHADYMTLSTSDMKQKLHALRGKWNQADQTAEALVRCLPERDALAFQCILVRDLFLVLELYGSCLRTARDSLGPQAPVIPAIVERSVPAGKSLPFSEWLFEPSG